MATTPPSPRDPTPEDAHVPGLNAYRRERLLRLLRGTRSDLARAEASKAHGYTRWVNGEPIDQAIETYANAVASLERRIAEVA